MADIAPEKEVRVSTSDIQKEAVVSTTSQTEAEHDTVALNNGTNEPSVPFYGSQRRRFFAYMKTPAFWLVLLLGQVLSLCETSTNTFTELLVGEGTSIPAFQTFFNYVLLFLIYTPYTVYRYGFKDYFRRVLGQQGWKYAIMSALDVGGNYTVVLAYNYTTILSAELINFWAIVVVVTISYFFLRVRYQISQVVGILVCCAGMGILIASDHITGSNGGFAPNAVKGDLFALLSATLYGFDNVLQEFLVSKAPLYEVVGQMGFWGIIWNGIIAGAAGRETIRQAVWNGKVAGYITGYTLTLTIFYSLTPILFRMSSAAFLNSALLTSNFWGVIIGIHVFHLSIYWMYPIAFTLIMVGLTIYFLLEREGGEALKPWLGERQEEGVNGVGTARRKIVHEEEHDHEHSV
jgi:solute carrier family 35 protein F1/2